MSEAIRVVDDNMNDVPKDGESLGEVVMQGNIVMKGYYNDPEALAVAWISYAFLVIQGVTGGLVYAFRR